MISVNEEILSEMTSAIVEAVDPERIILFGSHAQGGHGPDSDVDLMIVEDRPFGPDRSRYKEMARIRRALLQYRIPIDILLFSADEMNEWQHSINHIIARALREGRLLYVRS